MRILSFRMTSCLFEPYPLTMFWKTTLKQVLIVLILFLPMTAVMASRAAEVPPTASQKAAESWPVAYNEQVAFVFLNAVEQKSGRERAKEAEKALSFAIEAEKPKSPVSPMADVTLNQGMATLRVRGYVITSLYEEDARAAGFSNLKDYADHVTTLLRDFVPKQRRKAHLQDLFMRFFLSVFFALLGFVVLRQVRRIFTQFDHVLDEKKDSIKPFSLMSETLLTGEAIGGLLAFGLAVGRVMAYAVVTITTLAAILGQFSLTRNLLVHSISGSVTQFFKGFENLVGFIPGLILAAVLIIFIQAAFRVLDLFLKGISTGRIQWSVIPTYRAGVVRIVASLILVFVFGPLILASLFGSFGSPFEVLLILMGAVLLISLLPVLANWTLGMAVIWRFKVKPGEWIKVGSLQGEVSKVELGEISLVPLEGGSVNVPMLKLAWESIHHQEAPKAEILLELKSVENLKDALQRIQGLFESETKPQIDVLEFGTNKVQLHIALNILNAQALQRVFIEFASRLEEESFQVLTCQILKPFKG